MPAHHTSLAFDDQGDGVPFVLLHGLTFDRRSWRPVVTRLDRAVRSIAIDLPGHGESPGPCRSLGDVADQVHAVVVDRMADRPVVVGHSIGGRIALVYASRYRTRGVVAVDSSTDLVPLAQEMKALEPGLRSSFAETFAALEGSMDIDLIPDPLRTEVLEHRTVRSDVVLRYWDELFRVDPARLQDEFARTAGAITAPCLAVFGRRLTPDERHQVQWLLPTAEISEWPDRGHCLHLVEPDRFASALTTLADRWR